jgi:hypothetical protein
MIRHFLDTSTAARPVFPQHTPEDNFYKIRQLAKRTIRTLALSATQLAVDDLEEAVMSQCWDAFGPSGYNRATVRRALFELRVGTGAGTPSDAPRLVAAGAPPQPQEDR